NLAVGVSQQLEIQPLLRAEVLVRIHAVYTDPKHDGVSLGVLRLVALKVACFKRAPAGEISGIKIQHHPLSAIVLETDWLAFLRRKSEIRGHTANRWCR